MLSVLRLSSAKNGGKEKWMPCPKIETKHPGLVYLCPLEQLIVIKKSDAYHEVIGGNKIPFTIYNDNGEKVLIGTKDENSKDEDTIDIKVFNIYGNQIIQVNGPKHQARIWAPLDHCVGTIDKPKSCECNECTFLGDDGVEIKLKDVRKPITNENLQNLTNVETHEILREGWDPIGNLMEKCKIENVPLDNFCVNFPLDMDVQTKAAMLGACLVIWTD